MGKKKAVNKEKREMSAREKSTLIVAIVLFVALIIKSVAFDEVKNITGQALEFKEFVDYSVEQEYDGFLQNNKIMVYRVVKMFVADRSVRTLIEYVDPNTGQEIKKELDARYTAQVRGYLFGILPIKQFSVTAKVVENP